MRRKLVRRRDGSTSNQAAATRRNADTMDDSTKKLVQDSWSQVAPSADKAAELFYARLFELEPTLKLLFKAPMAAQGKLLMKALDGAVAGLSDVDALVPVLQNLGVRHAGYGVVDKDYDTVGVALLWTLGQGLGDGFTAEVEAAWTEVYGVVASVMKQAQAKVELSGPVSPREKRLVQGSWALVVPIADTAAGIFYEKLFEIEPSLRVMFKNDIKAQGKKLMQMLSTAVRGLDRLEEIVPSLQALGKRHVSYGVRDRDYDTVAEALLFTLEQGLGPTLTDEVRAAWVKVYTLLAETMKAAPHERAPAGKAQSKPPGAKSSARTGILVVGLLLVVTLIVGYL